MFSFRIVLLIALLFFVIILSPTQAQDSAVHGVVPLHKSRPGQWVERKPGTPTQSAPPDCFAWKIGTRIRGDAGEDTVIGARCSPANQLTQYWVRRPNGEQFWAPSQELKPIGR